MDKMGALSKAVVHTAKEGLSFVPPAVIVHRLGRAPAGFVMIFVGYRFDPE
jgi:hypothetical protein